MNISDIKPYSRNAKAHPKKQVEAIAASIKAFGCKQPVIVDKDGNIIVGHGRFFAMTEILHWNVLEERGFTRKGEEVIPYILADDLTEEEVKAYRLADNKLNESKWNLELVREELKDLSAPMLDLSGFKDLTIEKPAVETKKPAEESGDSSGGQDGGQKVKCPNCQSEFVV